MLPRQALNCLAGYTTAVTTAVIAATCQGQVAWLACVHTAHPCARCCGLSSTGALVLPTNFML